jgi:UDP-N-acetyl-D-mannosaminuronic acid transferase (WecB/TagA/CpsF family)
MIKIDKPNNIINFHGIKFYNFEYDYIMEKLKPNGYLVAPAAYPLSKIKKYNFYYKALKKSKVAIFDSGYLCLLIKFFFLFNVKKFSGFLFLHKFLNDKKNLKKKVLLVNPTDEDGILNKKLLIKKRFKKIFLYTSPFYMPNQKILDKKLIKYINKIKPNFILLNIAGFKQELLAEYIEKKIRFNVNTLCLGAAIAFITKKQAPINYLIDKLYLGWFVRVLFRPKEHFKRTVESFTLIKLFINNS